ncbi:hypothetical protein GOARA_022_00110 [Gordonia araii NBRC 100433]|uniref:Uncharacterized protein n=1 Tax=Gordonia araii NBRC 100433 TaxID=1073574 RepID=G7GZB0_9ACTN|nr:hypothetical protein [Gordonia araii]NNG98647.1 hypothetical protein [Gordonia araii NBRC 100433]GAB08935.1 hypothetical protein GOARA_022_00110 [Gordonia araii NBRC 100433]
MAMFVHIAPAEAVSSIRRAGIKVPKGRDGVYLTPRTANYVISHQWLRELKRGSRSRNLVAVDVRLPDDETVLVGHYSRAHERMSAAEAIALMMGEEDPRGFQAYLERPVHRREIHRVRRVSQVLGWRYWPQAHGNRPCACPACLKRGEHFGRRIVAKYGDGR